MPARKNTSKAKPRQKRPIVIGWKERVDFPDWGIKRVKAKVDTGARTSAVHVEEYALYEQPGVGAVAELHLALDRMRPQRLTIVQVPVICMVVVRNSGGQCETRPLVATNIRIGGVTKSILLTVTNRSSMLFRVLLGRRTLEGDFVVDVSRKYLLKRPPRRKRLKG